MKLMSKLIILISIIGAIYYGIPLLQDGNIYGFLVKMAIIITMFLPNILEKILKTKFPTGLKFVYIVFVFMAHYLGSIIDLYHKVSWFDTFTHFLSGILVSVLATYLIVKTKVYNNQHLIIWFLFIISMSTLVAVSWETFEFVCDKIFSADAQNVLTTGVNDTMIDMLVALLGSMIYGFMLMFEKLYNLNGIISKYIKSI